MDSQLALIEHPPATHREPGDAPLRNTKHELFAVARAAMFGLLEAARYAGYDHMTAGNAAKIDRMPLVLARVKFLAGDTIAAVKILRTKVSQKLNVVADVSLRDFIRMERDPGMVKHYTDTIFDEQKRAAAIAALPVLPYLDLTSIATLAPDEQREILSAVKSISYTEHGPKFELHSPLDAIAQLRKMSGLDEVEKHELTGALTLEALVGASYGKPAEEPKQIEQNDVSKQEVGE